MKPPIVGTLYTADRAGFLKMIADANEHSDTHALVNVFPVGNQLAAVFKRREREESKGGFFDPMDG